MSFITKPAVAVFVAFGVVCVAISAYSKGATGAVESGVIYTLVLTALIVIEWKSIQPRPAHVIEASVPYETAYRLYLADIRAARPDVPERYRRNEADNMAIEHERHRVGE